MIVPSASDTTVSTRCTSKNAVMPSFHDRLSAQMFFKNVGQITQLQTPNAIRNQATRFEMTTPPSIPARDCATAPRDRGSLPVRRGRAHSGDMTSTTLPGGTFTLAPDLTVTRMGYGAMQLAGPHVFGPPADRDAAVAVLREVVDLGITHIDTSDYYGPYVTNEIIKEALHPYPDSLHLVTKIGARRDAEGGWPQALAPEELRQAVHDNLDRLGLDALDVVNLRVGGFDHPEDGSIAEPFTALEQLQQEGLVKHLGISTVTAEQVAEAQSIAPIVCVQNFYNLAHRVDDELIDSLAEQGIAYVPYFPLGGFSPLQSDELGAVAGRLDAAPMAVALAWLLQRSPNILLIPGTSSVAHLRENVNGVGLRLSDDDLAELNRIGG
jgi:pyridoxine 4-dehydrogenase